MEISFYKHRGDSLPSMAMVLICLLLSAPLCLAENSPGQDRGGMTGAGGGGDPMATEFIRIAKEVQFVAEGLEEFPISSKAFSSLVADLELSLEGHGPRIRFSRGNTVSCFGSAKLACVKRGGFIEVAREGWQSASDAQKIELVTMEFMKISAVTGRYKYGPWMANKVIAERRGRSDLLQSPSAAARSLFGKARPANLEELRHTSWSCDSYNDEGLLQRQWNAFYFQRDPQDIDDGIVMASSRTANTVAFPDDSRFGTHFGELRSRSEKVSIRRLPSGSIIIRKRQSAGPSVVRGCEDGCATNARTAFDGVRQASLAITEILDSASYLICQQN